MLPASNRGTGMNFGFPDVCLTPAVPAPVPIPYPNMAMHAMAAPFSPNVLITMMNGLNMATKIPMTMGDDAGTAHPMFKQMGAFTMGNPIVFTNMLPAINLLCPTTGNNMNNPIGAVVVPAVTNVLLTLAPSGERGQVPGALDAAALNALRERVEAAATRPVDPGVMLPGDIGYVALRFFAWGSPAAVSNEIQALLERGMRALVLDLRGNPGGDLSAMAHLAEDFLPLGAEIVRVTDADGDEAVRRSRLEGPYRFPLVIIIDGGTGSAAELFAGCMQKNGRAVLAGEATFGKGTVQSVLPADSEGRALYATVASCALPGGASVERGGVEPDIRASSEGDIAVIAAWEAALAELSVT